MTLGDSGTETGLGSRNLGSETTTTNTCTSSHKKKFYISLLEIWCGEKKQERRTNLLLVSEERTSVIHNSFNHICQLSNGKSLRLKKTS